MEKRTESKVKDKAVKLAGGSVMDDFGIIMASQTHGKGGLLYSTCILHLVYHGGGGSSGKTRQLRVENTLQYGELQGLRRRRVTDGNAHTHRHSWRDPLDPPNPPTHRQKGVLHVYSIELLAVWLLILCID